MMESSQTSHFTKPRFLSRWWMSVPYALAGLYLVSVFFGLVIQHRLNNDYWHSFQYPVWAERSGRYASFGEDASVVNACAGRVINGAEVNTEWKTALDAQQAFDTEFARDEADLQAKAADAAQLLSELNNVKSSMDGLSQTADALFAYS